jgi:predicted aldo/keto reductase-like oxidoreductase
VRLVTRPRTRATCRTTRSSSRPTTSIEGESIADTLNGQVEIGVAYNDTAIQMGPSSEVILDHMTKNRYLREGAARIVRIIHPECFVSATVA